MGRSNGTPKSILIATRVTPRINDLIRQMAQREGLYVSEWVRKVIITELSEHGLLDRGLFIPTEINKSTNFDL
jgi:hypothetical protein